MSAASADRRVLVTGGAGFIGSHVVERLVRDGTHVVVLDDLSTGLRSNLPEHPSVALRVGDAVEADAVAEAIAGCGAVVHLAAVASVQRSVEDPIGTHRANLVATLQVLEAARRQGVRRFVYASSAAVYGDAAPLPADEDAPLEPLSPYAIDKLAGERYLRHYVRAFGLEAVALRFFNVYGPRQRADSPYSGVISRFVDRLERDDVVEVHGDGRQTRDFVAVADVADAVVRSLDAPLPDGFVVANVGTGRGTSLLELIESLGAALGRPVRPPRHGPPREGDVRDSRADVARLRSVLGTWSPSELRTGLASLVRAPQAGATR